MVHIWGVQVSGLGFEFQTIIELCSISVDENVTAIYVLEFRNLGFDTFWWPIKNFLICGSCQML